MSTPLLVLFLAAVPAAETATEASAGPPTMLVLTTRQAMAVRSYEVKGRLVHIVDSEGALRTLRTDMIDFEASKALTDHKRQEYDAAVAAEVAAEEKAAQDRIAADERRKGLEERNAAHRGMSGGGGFSVLGSSGGGGRPRPPASKGETEGDGGSTEPESPEDWTAKMAELRSKHRAATSERKSISDSIDSLLQVSNTNTPSDVASRAKIRELRAEMADLDQQLRTIQTEFASAREGARRSGAPAAVWRDPL